MADGALPSRNPGRRSAGLAPFASTSATISPDIFDHRPTKRRLGPSQPSRSLVGSSRRPSRTVTPGRSTVTPMWPSPILSPLVTIVVTVGPILPLRLRGRSPLDGRGPAPILRTAHRRRRFSAVVRNADPHYTDVLSDAAPTYVAGSSRSRQGRRRSASGSPRSAFSRGRQHRSAGCRRSSRRPARCGARSVARATPR